jgi:hypothetical protein
MQPFQTKLALRFLGLFLGLSVTHCGVKGPPKASSTDEGPLTRWETTGSTRNADALDTDEGANDDAQSAPDEESEGR